MGYLAVLDIADVAVEETIAHLTAESHADRTPSENLPRICNLINLVARCEILNFALRSSIIKHFHLVAKEAL